MKFSEQWLREWVDPQIDSAELVEQLTMLGLEVDGVERCELHEQIVVAAIDAVEPHPDADKLRVCSVDDGSGETLQIVCGAPNAAAGMRVPLARVGAELPGGLKIKRARLRGVASAGMLCSAAELGLSEDASGLMALPADAPLGESMGAYLNLDDAVIDIDLTANRGDCFSIRGIAKEVAARNQLDVAEPQTPPVAAEIDDALPIELDPAAGCARYCGRVLRGIDARAATPLWMAERLRRCGLRSISAVVDVTNYVMLELGQPMHAFDLAALDGGIRVRLAEPGERLEILDGRELTLDDDVTVIADHRRAVAVGGIMGGLHSGVTDDTGDVFLESAVFLPTAIMGRPRRYNAHTDSAHRYERGVDPELQRRAIERATALLQQIAGGRPGPVVEAVLADKLPRGDEIRLRRARLDRLLGVALPDDEVEGVLRRLGVALRGDGEDWIANPPSYRYDLRIEEDLIEELVRVHGYDRIHRSNPSHPPQIRALDETRVDADQLRRTLVERDYLEAITYSFVDPQIQRLVDPQVEALPLANPISAELSLMRTSLWPGLLRALQRNLNRQQRRVRLFEHGLRYLPRGGELLQEPMLAGLASGPRLAEQWGAGDGEVDFYDVRADLDALLGMAAAADVTLVAERHPALHPGQSASLRAGGETVGWIGRLHPRLQSELDLDQSAILFEINASILSQGKLPIFKEISRFPSIRRDIAIVADRDMPMQTLLACVEEAAPDYLTAVVPFDVYTGEHVETGCKSVALGLILQELYRTLTESEVEEAVARIVVSLQTQLGVTLRE